VVAAKFAEILKPFVGKKSKEAGKTLHTKAKQLIEQDTAGLALSLIMASENLQKKDKTWAWKVLELDGFSQQGDHLTLVKAKCGKTATEAWTQLDLRVRFIDAVACMVGKENKFRVSAYAAILERAVASEEKDESTDDLGSILGFL